MHALVLAVAGAALLMGGCAPMQATAGDRGTGPLAVGISAPEATSLLGEPLYPPPLPPEVRREREALLAQAQAAYDAAPDDEEAITWLGRRLAYLGRYEEAVAVYTDGLAIHPESYKLLRHRGHRYITLRRLPEAVDDLQRAAALILDATDEIEPDGLPNARNEPRSTVFTNIYYHLGLAKYLLADNGAARLAFARCLEYSTNDDMYCAAAYWLYLCRAAIGRDDRGAVLLEPVSPGMDVIENFAYRDLLLMFKGELTPEEVLGAEGDDEIQDATRAYGVGAWYEIKGQPEKADAIFRKLVASPTWPAFGVIAAEAALATADAQRQP